MTPSSCPRARRCPRPHRAATSLRAFLKSCSWCTGKASTSDMPETQQKEVMKDYLDFRGATDKSYPSPRDGEQFRSFWLLFPSTLFSFLLLMGLIIFSEKTHDLGRGVTAGGHWAPAGAACVCVCLCVWLRLLRTAPRSPWLASVGCWCPAGYRLRWVPGARQADPGALRKKRVQAQDLSLRHRPQAQTSAAQAVCAGLGAKEDSGTLPPPGVTSPSSGLSSRRSG